MEAENLENRTQNEHHLEHCISDLGDNPFKQSSPPEQAEHQLKLHKVLGYILDDLIKKQPQLPYPPNWLFNQLMLSHCKQFRTRSWLRDVRVITHELLLKCRKVERGEMIFLEKEGARSLFPTYDAYTFEDFVKFMDGFASFLKELEGDAK